MNYACKAQVTVKGSPTTGVQMTQHYPIYIQAYFGQYTYASDPEVGSSPSKPSRASLYGCAARSCDKRADDETLKAVDLAR